MSFLKDEWMLIVKHYLKKILNYGRKRRAM